MPRLGERRPAAVRAGGRLRQVVRAEPLLAVPAVDERVGEAGDVAARLPHLGRHEDRGVEADDVVAQLDHRAPPGVPDVALQLDAERAVVPGRAEPAVDLARLEHEAPALGEGRDGLHQVGHGEAPLSRPLAAAAGVSSSAATGAQPPGGLTEPQVTHPSTRQDGERARSDTSWEGSRAMRDCSACGVDVGGRHLERRTQRHAALPAVEAPGHRRARRGRAPLGTRDNREPSGEIPAGVLAPRGRGHQPRIDRHVASTLRDCAARRRIPDPRGLSLTVIGMDVPGNGLIVLHQRPPLSRALRTWACYNT